MRIDFPNNSFIESEKIEIGKDFQVGANVQIKVRKKFSIGDFSRFGDDVKIDSEEVKIGSHFFHLTPGLRIGGGGSHYPGARIEIGNECVLHDNYLNTCYSIHLGNDVGLSPGVDVLTHGFWGSALEGYPYKYEGVTIGSGTIVGYKSLILPGVHISQNCVIGAGSVVVKSLLEPKSVYVGNPAKFVRKIEEPGDKTKKELADRIIDRYLFLLSRSNRKPYKFVYEYPLVFINDVTIHLLDKKIIGEESDVVDDFRDHLRRYGIKIHTLRGFGRVG